MATNLIKMTIQLRRDTAANWELYKDKTPAVGEPCFVIDENILKIGDGIHTFEQLEPINVKIAADGKSIVLDNNTLKLMGFDDAPEGAQPQKGKDGKIEWVVPSTEVVDTLKSDVTELKTDVGTLKTNVGGLQTDVAGLKAIVGSADEGTGTLLSRVEGLEKEIDTILHGLTPDDGKIDSLVELINYVETHGKKTAKIVSDITSLQELVGSDPVKDQIATAIANSGHMSKAEAVDTLLSKVEARATYDKVKYEITNTPVGTLVDYREKEIRVMVPSGAQFIKQNVGATGNANIYYMGFKAYAPEGAVSFKEGDRGVIVDKMHDFNDDFAGIDEFGRKYSICWLGLASYDSGSNAWTYYGKNSTVNKYIGWTYCVEWYDANGVVIGSDSIRINLSNEGCHSNIEPYYMNAFVKEVAVNGTLLGMLDGRVDITIPEIKESDEIAVNEDGSLSIKAISFDKIVQNPEITIVMDGGNAV